MSHKQPVDIPIKIGPPTICLHEEVNDKDLSVPSSGPQPIGHTTVQHLNDTDFIDNPGPARSQAPPPTNDPNEGLGTPNSDDDSLPFLGDPEPKFFGEMTLPSISLIGVAALKQLINAGEEVYTINI